MSEIKSKVYLDKVNMENQRKKAEEALEYMQEQRENFFDEGEDFEALSVCLSEYSKEDIMNFSLEQLQEVENKMREAGFGLSQPEGLDVPEDEYLRDLISYLKDMIESEEQLVKLINKFDTDITRLNEEVETVMKDYSHSIIKLMREEIANNPKFKDSKLNDLYTNIMTTFDSTFSLEPVLDIAKQLDVRNTINDYKFNKAGVYKQYLSALKRLNVKHDIAQFSDVQKMVTDKKYEGYDDFLIFILMKYIAKRNKSVDFSKKIDGVFASQLCTNLYLLASDVDDEVIQHTFKDSCKKLLEIYLG